MRLVMKGFNFVYFLAKRDELRELLSRFFSSGAKRVSGVVFSIFHSKNKRIKAVTFELVQLTNL